MASIKRSDKPFQYDGGNCNKGVTTNRCTVMNQKIFDNFSFFIMKGEKIYGSTKKRRIYEKLYL